MFLLDQKCFESIFVFFVNFFLYLVQGFDFLFFSERIASLLTALGYYLENSRYWVVAAPILVGTNMIRIAQMVSSLSLCLYYFFYFCIVATYAFKYVCISFIPIILDSIGY